MTAAFPAGTQNKVVVKRPRLLAASVLAGLAGALALIPEAVDPLISALMNRNQKIRLGAIAALGGMGASAR